MPGMRMSVTTTWKGLVPMIARASAPLAENSISHSRRMPRSIL